MNNHHKAGAQAYKSGAQIIDNPHQGSYAGQQWKEGYLAAQQIEMIKDSLNETNSDSTRLSSRAGLERGDAV